VGNNGRLKIKRLISSTYKRNEPTCVSGCLPVYQFVHHAAVAVLAFDIAVLHCGANAALPCGVAAAFLKASRWASKLVFSPGAACGAFAAIVVRHASYLVMYSSHSATPVFGLDESVVVAAVLAGAVVVVDDVVVVDVAFAGLFAVVLLVAAPPQPNEIIAKQRVAAIAMKLLIFIKGYSSLR
jgi:hypothetical protein